MNSPLMSRMRNALLTAALVCLAFGSAAVGQTWAAKPIRMVVPFPPGPALDLVARLVGTKMSEALGQPVVIENRSGANGAVGSEFVARAAPDGYTILAGTAGTHVTAVHLVRSLPYDPIKDFTPITAAVEPVTCLTVHVSVPVNSVKELIAYAQANPGKLSYGSSGVGSVFHLMGELFHQTTGVELVHVPYKGVAPAVSDLVGGHVPMVFTSISAVQPYMGGGQIKVLAILEPQRFPAMRDIPSISETVPAFQKPSSWLGFFGPPNLPPPILARIHGEMVKALRSPDVQSKLEDAGLAVTANSPEEFAALLKDGIEKYGRIIQAAGIQPE
jgi:tripartite-type tricarboxylate transporter receptor subunit TctC